MIRLFVYVNCLRFWPHWLWFRHAANRHLMAEDLKRWRTMLRPNAIGLSFYAFAEIMTFFPAFRNLLYSRIRNTSRIAVKLLELLAHPLPLLDVCTRGVSGGLYIQHGYATIIAAKKMGRNCQVLQNVTIGHTTETDQPVIGDNVYISAGAKVLGSVTIGDNVIVGANCVVVKDVPANCTVVGVPAYIVKRNGVKVHEEL
jgi:serine O-acetyltransferase